MENARKKNSAQERQFRNEAKQRVTTLETQKEITAKKSAPFKQEGTRYQLT